jgi:L-lysine exporter family protein LysE/ArgO
LVSAFVTGFLVGISLIVAIGAQNTFVLRQGIIGRHVFYVALFCSISDALLITIGVSGISFFLSNYVTGMSHWLLGFSAIWLSGYGILRLKAAFKAETFVETQKTSSQGLLQTLSIITILTFANPHVYLDTMILIGSLSQQFSGENKIAFTIGASTASFTFFFSLAYGARLLKPLMESSFSWRILDFIIAIIMFSIAIKLGFVANWI